MGQQLGRLRLLDSTRDLALVAWALRHSLLQDRVRTRRVVRFVHGRPLHDDRLVLLPRLGGIGLFHTFVVADDALADWLFLGSRFALCFLRRL